MDFKEDRENFFKKDRFLFSAIFISVLLHFLFLIPKINFSKYINIKNKSDLYPIASNSKSIPIEIYIKEPKENKIIQDEKLRQIVQSEGANSNFKTKEAKYYGEKDLNFLKESVAKNIGKFENGRTASELNKSGNKENRKNLVQIQKGTKKISLNDLKLSDEGLKKTIQGQKELNSDEEFDEFKELQGDDLNNQKISATNDYIQDIPLGDVTNLNTKEFKYYGFYFRIKQKLEQYWGSSLKEKVNYLHAAGRTIATNQDMMTSLIVTLDNKGHITNVALKNSSGVKELDDAAIESFKKAGPFPNPPPGMVIEDKVVVEWGFVLKG